MPGIGMPALLAYAFSQSPSDYDPARNPQLTFHQDGAEVYPQVEYRRRLGGEGQRLEYSVQISSDGLNWQTVNGELDEIGAVNPWDGSGTEIVTLRSPGALANAAFRFARISVEVPL